MTWLVEVDVALSRPPRADATVYFALSEADFSRRDAELTACQLSLGIPRVVMPVGSRISQSNSDL